MRKSLLTAMGIVALVLAVPSAALAHHGRGHHRHHHHHHGAALHHAKFRIVHIGAGASGSAPPSTTPPTTPPPENAGTVTSYTGGVLTLTLNDGSTVSGKVTANTRIHCVKATPPTGPVTPMGQGPGDDNGQGDDQNRGDMDQGEHGWGGCHHGGKGDDDGVEGTPEPPCDSSSLTPGAIVRAAELHIGPGGTEFENILLVR